MLGCDGCREQLLDHLYDLLEEGENRAFLEHLGGCTSCQGALEAARAQKQLLARAARITFPDMAFLPPAEPAPVCVPATEPEPVVLPLRPRRYWVRLACAAAILLALTASILPAYRTYEEYRTARDTVAHHEKELAEARERFQQSRAELRQVAEERKKEIESIERAIKMRELRLVVSGPRTVQPGAPADFYVQAFDLDGQPAEADVVAHLNSTVSPATTAASPLEKTRASGFLPPVSTPGSGSGGEVHSSPAQPLAVTTSERGRYRIQVPPTLRLQPGGELGMVVSARKKGVPAVGEPVSLRGEVKLSAPVFLTHLTTDKPMYQPGETVRFRSLTIDRSTLAPVSDNFVIEASLTTPTGSVLPVTQGQLGLVKLDDKNQPTTPLGPDGKPVQGVGVGEFPLAPEWPGGEYTLQVREEANRFPAVTRKFLVNNYQKPRLDKKLDFNRSSYGAGDSVQAKVTARRADGGPVKGKPVEVTVNIDDRLFGADGKESGTSFPLRTDDDGAVLVRFQLPRSIERGQASLAVKFEDDGIVETLVRPIPVVVKKLGVEFFPEGGDLVAGLPNRVYFQARTPLGKPAQLRGTLLENGQPLPIPIETLHDDEKPGVNQGNGAFTFTPRARAKYEFRIDVPTGIAERKQLPRVREEGVVLTVPRGVFEPNEPIPVQVHSKQPRTLLVGAYCRGQLLDTMSLEKGKSEVLLRPRTGAGGVCRITVFEELATGQPQRQLRPVAERLVYRHPGERLDISIQPDRRRYAPGQKAKLTIATTNEAEKLTPSLAMVAVVDRSVTTLADEKTARTMPTYFLMTTEVRKAEDLEYADFLLGPHPRASVALDLLLGTQGWRRFAEQDPEQFRNRWMANADKVGDAARQDAQADAERLLVMIGQSAPRKTDFDKEKIDQVIQRYIERQKDAQERAVAASETLAASGTKQDHLSAVTVLSRFEARKSQILEVSTPVLGLIGVVLASIGLVQALRRRAVPAWTLGGVAALCGLGMLMLPKSDPGKEAFAVDTSHDGQRVARMEPLPEGAAAPPAGPAMQAEAFALDQAAPIPPPRPEDAPMGRFGGGGPAMLGGMGGMPGGLGGMPGGGAGGPVGRGGPGGLIPVPRPLASPPPGPPGAGAPRAAMKDPAVARREGRVARGGAPKMAGDLAPKAKKQVNENRDHFRGAELQGIDRRKLAKEDGLERFAKDQAERKRALQDRLDPMFKKLAEEAKDKEKGELRLHFERALDAGKGVREVLPLVFREYAHHRPTDQTPAMRQDFTETLYWHPVLLLPNGKGEVSFDLCDSVTSFEATVFAHTLDGRLGAAKQTLESSLPVTLAIKLPVEVTATDRMEVPVAITNNTTEARNVELKLANHLGMKVEKSETVWNFQVPPAARSRHVYSLRPTLAQGQANLTLEARTETYGSERLRETVRVVPDGFPATGSSSELLERSATHRLNLPAFLPGTLQVQVDVYPSTLADLQKGLEGLLREPNGCFEQSSTTNYPNVLILEYLRSSDRSDPALEKRTRELLDRGYQRLTSFECQKPTGNGRQGYEWFGGAAPPHEALTAYGLMQFSDMARVHTVDREMLTRTKTYLLGQRDGSGGYKRNNRALDTFGSAPAEITNAYIVWALTESGDDDVSRELEALVKQAETSKDAYFLSLVALSLSNRSRTPEASALLQKVRQMQTNLGDVPAAKTSITGSGGRDLVIETTALAVLAWLKTDVLGFDPSIRKAVAWIGQQRGGSGAFGSTQSTILALKALIAWTRANKRTVEAGELRLFVGEDKVADRIFPAGANETLTLSVPEAEKRLKPGVNALRVEITGAKNIFPHTLSWSCRTVTPQSAKDIPVNLGLALARTDMNEGDSVRLKVRLENVSGQDQGMAVAILGLPAGLIVPEDLKQLKEHCRLPEGGKRPLLGAFEIKGRELVLYWRNLARGEIVEIPIDLIARVPGEYRGPACRAYLYYNADHKHWLAPLEARIKAKE